MEKQLRELIADMEWSSEDADRCLFCGRWKADGHNSVCRMGKLALLATRTEASRAPAEPQSICKHCGKPIVICSEGKDCAFDRWNHPDTGSHYCGDACEGATALPAPAEGFEKWWMKWSTDEANYRMLDEITISHQADLVGAFKNCWLEAERVARIDLLKEMASSECRACKDNSNLIIDEESGEWAHERGEGLPNYLCQAPDVVAEKLAALGAEKEDDLLERAVQQRGTPQDIPKWAKKLADDSVKAGEKEGAGYKVAHCKHCGKADNLHRGSGLSTDESHIFEPQSQKILTRERTIQECCAAICERCSSGIPLDKNGRHTDLEKGHVGSHCYAKLMRAALGAEKEGEK